MKQSSSEVYDMVLYSAHDSSLLVLLQLFGMTSSACLESLISKILKGKAIGEKDFKFCKTSPSFSQDLRLELINKNNRKFVAIKYDGSYLNICYTSRAGKPYICGMCIFFNIFNLNYIF